MILIDEKRTVPSGHENGLIFGSERSLTPPWMQNDVLNLIKGFLSVSVGYLIKIFYFFCK